MEKRISYSAFQSVKAVAKACDPINQKKEKLQKQIEKLQKECDDYDLQIQSLEEGIRKITGFRVYDLVKKVIEPGVDANGKPKKTTKYLPTDIVSYDEVKRQYVITTPDESAETKVEVKETVEEEKIEVPAPSESVFGNDFDKDTENIEAEASDPFEQTLMFE